MGPENMVSRATIGQFDRQFGYAALADQSLLCGSSSSADCMFCDFYTINSHYAFVLHFKRNFNFYAR